MAVKLTEAKIVAETLLKKVDFARRDADQRRVRFEVLGKDQLIKKIMGKTSNSPYFYMQSWGSASPGGSTNYTVHVHNPDPSSYSGYWLFGHLFFGPANFITDSDLATTLGRRINARFSESAFAGLFWAVMIGYTARLLLAL